MLERIEEIQGIGLLYQVNGKPHTLHKASLIYSDNGRGKSTIAAIMRSLSTGNAGLVSGAKTVDGTLAPKVVLQFENGHKVSFQNGAWSDQRPELLVFDVDFVGRNVHSGGVVSTDHRKNLLEFALGEAAVSARTTLDSATAQAKAASEEVRNVTNLLSGYHTGLTLAQFEQLAQLPDIDQQIDNLQRRITAASNIAAIQAKPIPKQSAEPAQDIDSAFEILNLSLADIHANAEQIVKQHIEALANPEAEKLVEPRPAVCQWRFVPVLRTKRNRKRSHSRLSDPFQSCLQQPQGQGPDAVEFTFGKDRAFRDCNRGAEHTARGCASGSMGGSCVASGNSIRR